LREEVQSLKQRQGTQPSDESTVAPNPKSKPHTKEPVAAEEGMTLQQVATAIGMNYSNLSQTRNKMSVEAFLEYLHQKSGLMWRYDAKAGRYGKYFRVTAEEG